MKQYITSDELVNGIDFYKWESLADKGLLKDRCYFDETTWEEIAKEFTIGKMIEIINDSGECLDMFNGNENGRLGKWCVWVGTLGEVRDTELCDALWEAVKYILQS